MGRFDFKRREPYEAEEFLGMLRAEALHKNARLEHPYVKRLVEGKLTLDQLRDFAKQDYQLKRCPTWWVAGRILNCPTIVEQKMIIKIFAEEMGGPEPGITGHQAMYLEFGKALGLGQEAMERAPLLPSTVLAVEMLMQINRRRSVVEGLASGSIMGESINVRVSQMLVPAFEKHYRLPREGLVWFLEHIEADREHGGTGERIVKKYATSKDMQDKIWDCIIKTKAAWWIFFDGLHSSACSGIDLPRYGVGEDLPECYPMEPF